VLKNIFLRMFGVPSRTGVEPAALEAKPFTVIEGDFAAWIALSRTLQTHGYCYWTLNGLFVLGFLRLSLARSPSIKGGGMICVADTESVISHFFDFSC
jgi:hypothetical protein